MDLNPPQLSADQLPNEVLTEFMSYVPTADLLNSCRLVSNTWYHIATPICRNRRIKVVNNNETKGDLVETFKNKLDLLPWSAVGVDFTFDKGQLQNQEFCDQISIFFGNHIKSLSVDLDITNYPTLVSALSCMPNLQELHILPLRDCYSETNFVFPTDGQVQLRKLKHFQLECEDAECEYLDLLKFILRNVHAHLTSVDISGNLEDFDKMYMLLHVANISKLTLEMCYYKGYETWSALGDLPNLKMHDLLIFGVAEDNGFAPNVYEPEAYDLLERVLGNCVGLTKLNLLEFEAGTGPTPILNLFQIPRLPDLEQLKIGLNPEWMNDCAFDEYNPDVQIPIVHFHRLRSSNFPNLKTIYLSVTRTTSLSELDIRRLFDSTEMPFESVKNLNLKGYYGGKGRLASIFPNVSSITSTIEDSRQIPPILDGMKNTIELFLKLSNKLDNNALFMEIFGFILPLTKLDKLEIQCIGSESKALDVTGAQFLLQLHPMRLTMVDVEVHKNDLCVSQLRAIHTCVEFFIQN